MNWEDKVALIVWRSGPLGEQCQTSMKQKLLLKLQERVRKGRDTECRGGAARKEVWEAEIRRRRGKWCQKWKEEKTDGTNDGERRTQGGNKQRKRGRNKGIRKEGKDPEMLPSLSITLSNTRQIPNPHTSVGHFSGCKCVRLKWKTQVWLLFWSKNDDWRKWKRKVKKLAWCSTFRKLRSWHLEPSLHGK